MKFDISEYAGQRCAMHCSTEDDASTFLSFLRKLGKSWCNGDSYTRLHYRDYGYQTAYAFNEDKYGSIDWYRNHNFIVLEFEDFEWDDDVTPLSNRDLKRIDNFFSQFVIK